MADSNIDADETQHDFAHYLPATAGLTSEPGPVERFLKTVFRPRGEAALALRQYRR